MTPEKQFDAVSSNSKNDDQEMKKNASGGTKEDDFRQALDKLQKQYEQERKEKEQYRKENEQYRKLLNRKNRVVKCMKTVHKREKVQLEKRINQLDREVRINSSLNQKISTFLTKE